MRGIQLPDREEDFSADPSELFFDLAFVFAFSRLVFLLVHHPDWTGIGQFTLLMFMIWLPWSQFTWSANAVAGNSRPVRLLFLLATVASVPMAASVNSAFDGGAPVFAISLSIILGMGLFTMIAGTDTSAELRAAIITYSIPNFVAMGVLIIGAFLSDGARVGAWILAMLIVLYGTIRAGGSEWLVRPGHFAERHGLILIVALGEVIVALALPVVEALEENGGLSGMTLAALLAAGAFVCLLWWGYFDRPNPAVEHRHNAITEPFERGQFARNVYTYSHLPMIAGVILAAAALEEIGLHPDEPLPTPFRWMLFAGLALYIASVVISIVVAYGVVARERLTAAVVLLIATVVATDVSGVVLLVAVDLILFAMLVAEHVRVEVRPRTDAATA